MYRYLVVIRFFQQPPNFICRHFFNLRSRALSPQSHSALRIAQETSARFPAHSFQRLGKNKHGGAREIWKSKKVESKRLVFKPVSEVLAKNPHNS